MPPAIVARKTAFAASLFFSGGKVFSFCPTKMEV
jgi:hypothetical protein